MDDKTFKGLQIERLKAVPSERLMILAQVHDKRVEQSCGDILEDCDRQNTVNDWVSHIVQGLSKVCKPMTKAADVRRAMIEIAALAVAAVEAVDEANGFPPRHCD